MGKEAEVVSHGEEGIPVYSQFTLAIKVSQYAPVFPQQSVNVPYEIVCFTVKPVVVVVSALVRTEFLIGTATDSVAAIETFFFHSTNVLIKLVKIVFNRLQTTLNILQPHINI